jgi:hypothetical protein
MIKTGKTAQIGVVKNILTHFIVLTGLFIF